MQKEIEFAVIPEKITDLEFIKTEAAKQLNLAPNRIFHLQIRKRSIDARGKKVVFRLFLQVFIDEEFCPPTSPQKHGNVSAGEPVIIVGAGPAGLFAALQCIENGRKPIVLERGKNVRDRRRDLAALNKSGIVNPDSNYCFGEGGAGTYSDGKLYTRSHKRGDLHKVLHLFVEHGATEDILIDARPHIGTNKLPHIIERIRNTILESGGEIHFNTKVVDIDTQFGAVCGVKLQSGDYVAAKHVIMATGHSARDTYRLLHQKKWALESKPFALGVRIEHPQYLIDRAQYHCEVRSEYLPPAYYNLVEQVDKRGVFSFCMCPGGIIAPCATKNGEIVVNGWSPSKRNNPYANSGMVVQVSMEDIKADPKDPLALLHFQQEIEQQAYQAGGGDQVAPAQRMVDFVNGKVSSNLPVNSYKPGTKSVDLHQILPTFISQSLKTALPRFGKKMWGYYTNDAVLVGVESRTSSPVRIPRDRKTLQHQQVMNLYPCGEGAGYAGGIISAAIDGINCANAIFKP